MIVGGRGRAGGGWARGPCQGPRLGVGGHRVGVAGGERSVRGRRGFTLIELLVVTAIVAILASLLLPALSGAKGKAGRIQCLGNYRQLQLCWQMYVDDFQEWLPPNATTSGGGREGWIATGDTWIAGNAYTDVNTLNIERGVLFPYNRSVGLYKCPSDRSTVRDRRRVPRVRSVSMNAYLNDDPNPAAKTCWHRLSEIRNPAPAQVWVFIDEHENSIENARFVATQPGVLRWVDFPAARHQGSAVLSFADGHAEAWRWREPNTLAIAAQGPWIQGPMGVRGDRDLARIQSGVPVLPLP